MLTLCMPTIIKKRRALLQYFEYVFSMHDSVLAVESTCLKSASEHEEIEETTETEEEAKGPAKRGN